MRTPLPRPAPETDPRALAIEVARFLDSKRATDIVVLDVQELLPISSFFVIATGASQRALQTLGEGAAEVLELGGLGRVGFGGLREGRWVCLDHGEVIVHLFDPPARTFYALDELWGDAPQISFPS